uniref:MIF4G domain-containing protein n=1 Tax=Globodera pallida TaxID=36090 RepID=A0A183CGD6_GLOPA
MFGMQNGGEGFEKETAAEENNFKRKNDEPGDEEAQKAQKLQKIAKIKDENLEHFNVAAASCKKMKISKLDFGKIDRAVQDSAPQSRLPRIETAGENNFKRKTEFGDEEAQKGQKLQKIAKIKDENLEHFDVSAASCKKIEISKLDFGKISRAFHYFAQSRLYRMELIDKMISAISLRESIAKRQILNPSQATAFSLQKLHVFSAGKAVDMAMLGIEIAMLPFENLWQNGQGERVEMAEFVSEKFGFLACAVMGMDRPAQAVLKEIMGVMREFLRGNDKKHLMTALAVVNDIEKFVDGIPTRNGQVQNNEKLMNLDFYIEYFNKMGRMCSPPIVSATIVNNSAWFRNLCQQVQLFTTALVDEFSRIRKK